MQSGNVVEKKIKRKRGEEENKATVQFCVLITYNSTITYKKETHHHPVYRCKSVYTILFLFIIILFWRAINVCSLRLHC